jgi:hypothetical protein
MAVLAGLNADAQQLSRQQIGGACLGASGNLGFYAFLTNATVAAANTNQGLQDAVTAAVCHADESYAKARVNLGIQLGSYSTELSDARVAPLTTTTELVGLTYASVSQSAAFPPE